MSENMKNRKELTDALSHSIYEGNVNGEKIAQLLSQLNKVDKSSSSKTKETSPKEEKIGIYLSKNINGKQYFVPDPKLKAEFNSWSKKTDPIPEKSPKKRRVIFFGESVARGWFYEPFYSPASVLEDILHLHFSSDIEVVDLAVTSITPDELLKLFEEALLLSGDTYVVFAGNNWKLAVTSSLTGTEANEIYNEIISGDPSFEVINNHLSNAFTRIVELFFIQLKKIISGKNIDVLFIIPEFNLLDFQSSETEKEMFMPNVKTKKWLEIKEQGEKVLKKNDWNALSKYAEELIDLNPFHPLGYELLAKCNLAVGEVKLAKSLLQSACDTLIYRTTNTSPRLYGNLKKVIISNCDKHKIYTLRLDEIFDRHLGGKIPDRTLFMDYCHLTLKGIEISMIECAKMLVKIWTGSEETAKDINNYEIKYDREVVSIAHFLAALHNNLCTQNFEIIDYHCRKSFENNKNIIHKMHSYMRMAISNTPWKVNKESLSFVDNKLIEMGMFHHELYARVESHMSKSIRDILDENNLTNDFAEKLLEEYLACENMTHLLQPKYATDSFQCISELVLNGKSFYSEIKLESKFNFIASSKHPINIEITYRVPKGSSDEFISLSVNNNLLVKLPAHSKWNKYTFTIPIHNLQAGINSLSIMWPLPSSNPKKNDSLNSISDLMSAISPVLGEIYTLNTWEENRKIIKENALNSQRITASSNI